MRTIYHFTLEEISNYLHLDITKTYNLLRYEAYFPVFDPMEMKHYFSLTYKDLRILTLREERDYYEAIAQKGLYEY